MTNLFLFFHLLGAFCFFAGGAVVGVLQLAAIRQERPSEVYALLRLAPFGAALVGTGALLTLGFGIALAEHEGLGLSLAWIQAALGLWVAAMVLGAFGGRTARRARRLAKTLASEGDAPSPELRALVSARGPLWASYASFVLLLAIIGLMVWQPGSSDPAPAVVFPKSVQKEILRSNPKLAFLPTRLPIGVKYSRYDAAFPDHPGFHLTFTGPDGQDRLSFSVYFASEAYPGTCSMSPSVTINGYAVVKDVERDVESAFRCARHDNVTVLLEADAATGGPHRAGIADLETVVAYAEPFN